MTRIRPLWRIVICVLLGPCFFFISVSGQSATATLSGTVQDENGAVIPNVQVTIANTATTLRRETTTNGEGYFTVPLLQPGRYTLTARRDGFAPVQVENIILNVGDQKSLEIQLKAGDISATVQITNEATLINESPAVSTVVDRQFVENIPLNGRSFQSLIALTPGVVLTRVSAVDGQGQFSVNGQRANSNYFTVDGVSANVAVSPNDSFGQTASGSLPALSIAGTTSNLVSVDALQEFRVQTSTYAPEFGRSPGAQVQILTRSGTNDFHGTLFEYFRNEALDANDWFANSRRLKRAPLRQNDFGGVIGGPVFLPRFGTGGTQPWYDGRNRTFFFFSYEGLRLRVPKVAIVNVPSLPARQAAPAAIRPFLDAFPLPTGPAGANGLAELAATFSDPTTLNATSIRIDHTVRDKLTLFGRYNYAPSHTVLRGGFYSLSVINPITVNTQTLTIGATLFLTSGISNEFRGNYSRSENLTAFQLDQFGGAIPPPDSSVVLPSSISRKDAFFDFFAGGGVNVGFGGHQFNQLQRQVNLVDNLLVVSGGHQLKFGVDYRRLTPLVGPQIYRQVVAFDSIGVTAPGVPPPVGSVLSGRASTTAVVANTVSPELLFTNFSLYGQDTWQATKRLTLTYGLRWEVNPPFSERNGNDPFTVVGLDNPTTLALGPRGRLYETTYNNFAPRIGATYQLSQKQGRESLIRGGFGLFYDTGAGSAVKGAMFNSAVIHSTTKILPSGTTYPPAPALLEPAPFTFAIPSTFDVVDPHLKLPLVYQWNATVQQSFGSNQTFSAAYVAAVGRRLLRREVLFRPNPNFVFVNVTRNRATSDYHSLQLQFQRRLSKSLQALASYTWSHSIDIASEDSSALTPGARIDPRQDRGPSNFDVRHALTGAVTYNLPTPDLGTVGRAALRNWSIDTIFTARSAAPVDIIYRRKIGFGTFFFRPDLITGIPLYIDDPTAPGGLRFNNKPGTVPGNPSPQIGPFISPVEARQGTLGRNALRGFPASQIDFAFRRQFSLAERLKVQLKAELFNAFNHPNFAAPDNVLGSFAGALFVNNQFGSTTSMLGRSLGGGGTSGGLNPLYQVGGPRSIQLTLRMQF